MITEVLCSTSLTSMLLVLPVLLISGKSTTYPFPADLRRNYSFIRSRQSTNALLSAIIQAASVSVPCCRSPAFACSFVGWHGISGVVHSSIHLQIPRTKPYLGTACRFFNGPWCGYLSNNSKIAISSHCSVFSGITFQVGQSDALLSVSMVSK